VLVVVEDRYVQRLLQRLLHLEGGRRRYVLQVDATERGCQRYDRLDELGGTIDVQADREGVHPTEFLEQQGLSLHDRKRRLRAYVSEAQDGRAVGDDGHGVLLDGQVVDPGRLVVDGHADTGHSRRVRH